MNLRRGGGTHNEFFNLFCNPLDEIDENTIHRLDGVRSQAICFLAKEDREELANLTGNEAWRKSIRAVSQPGLAMVPVVVDDRNRYPLLAPAAILPVRWTESPVHGDGLPQTLLEVAQRVREALSQSTVADRLAKGESIREFHLNWVDTCWSDWDFQNLPLSADSAFASLAIGLLSAVRDTPIHSDFLATGAYHDGQWRVSGLEFKLQHAVEHGFTRVAVPYADRRRASDRPFPAVEALHNNMDLGEAIQAACLLAGDRPGKDAPLRNRLAWYHALTSPKQAFEYYCECLIDDVVKLAREKIRPFDIAPGIVDDLITIQSNSDELVLLSARVFQPKRLHVIHAGEGMAERWRRSEAEIRRMLRDVETTAYAVSDDLTGLDSIRQIIANLPRRDVSMDCRSQSGVLIDALPGRRVMSLAMTDASRVGDRMICWWQDQHPPTKRPEPMSLKPLVWECRRGDPHSERPVIYPVST